MFEKYKVSPPDLARWTIPQIIAVLTEPSKTIPDVVECRSMQEAIDLASRIR
jgi:hypothetical protein